MSNFSNATFEYGIIGFVLLFSTQYASASTFIVGPLETYKKISEVTSLIDHGDTILVKMGIYTNDKQVTIAKNFITVLGEAGRPILRAGSIIANDQSNGKGIFVIKGNNVTIDNIAFHDATVVDHNGAGIRQEGCNLKVLRCLFLNNEMGILCGTIPNCKTTIEYCEFLQNGSTANPGYQHNVYINNIDTLIFRFNTSIDAIAEGHELKSRAKFNYIAYNNIANYTTKDSRSIDLPNGGISIILGNVIEQGPNSANNNILGYGLEGLSNPTPHKLYIVNNTFVNRRGNGSHIHIPTATLDKFLVQNNIFVGGGSTINGIQDEYRANVLIEKIQDAIPFFVDFDAYNYNLLYDNATVDVGIPLNESIGNYSLTPTFEFHHIDKIVPRNVDGKIDVGAFEYAEVSLANDFNQGRIKLYPNPASNFITIEGFEEANIEIFNVSQGKKVMCEVFDQLLDVSSLPSGTYAMKVGEIWFIFAKL